MLAWLWESIQRLFSGSSAKAVTTYSSKSAAARQGILNMPSKVRLKPTSEIAWSDPRQAEAYQKFLAAENLTSIGRFKMVEFEGCYLEAYVDDEREFYATILQFQNLLYLDLSSSYEDNTAFTVCDSTQNMSDRPPWQTTLFLAGKSPKQLLKTFLEKRPQESFQLVGADFFVDRFCQAYVRETRWRKSQITAGSTSSGK